MFWEGHGFLAVPKRLPKCGALAPLGSAFWLELNCLLLAVRARCGSAQRSACLQPVFPSSCNTLSRSLAYSIAPLMKWPLIKKLGVPCNPSFWASCASFFSAGNCSPLSQALIETVAVELERARLRFHIGHLQFFRLKQVIVELPEFSLYGCAPRALSGFGRLGVHGKREILVHQRHLIAKVLQQPDEIRVHFLAIRTLIIRVFDDLHRSGLGTQPRGAPSLDVGARLVQFDNHAILCPQSVTYASRAFFMRSW